MTAFKSYRVTHEFTQTNPASPEKVFPLLCPVREADWVPGWRYNLIYSDSGVAELGCIFTTQDSTKGSTEDATEKRPEHLSHANPHHSAAPHTAPHTAPLLTTWICIDYDPAALRIAFVWIKPGLVATELRIQLSGTDDGQTRSHIRFRYTGLSPEGNREAESYDRAWFEAKMRGWEAAINHYLNTGDMIPHHPVEA